MTPLGSVVAVQLGTLVRVTAAMHSVPATRLPALKARFGNFHRLNFPEMPDSGTGTRAEYWPEHVAQLLVAFELLRFRIPQPAAAHCASAFRAQVLGAVGDAARRLAGGEERQTILSLSSNSLLEDAKHPVLADLALRRVPDAGGAFDGASTTLTIDAVQLVERAAHAARSTNEPFGADFFARLTSAAPADTRP